MPIYIPLRNHSSYSLLEGSIPLNRLIQRALEYQLPAIGLADTSHLFGALEFSLACEKKGLHPLIGCQISVMVDQSKEPCHLVLYAKNTEGYRNLCRLVTDSTVGQPPHLRGYLSPHQLSNHTQGIICLTGGAYGLIDQQIHKGQMQEAADSLDFLKNLFPGHLYIEISRHEPLPGEDDIHGILSSKDRAVENQLIEWALDHHIPLVATNRALFMDPQDHEAHDALRCIALGRYVAEEDRPQSHPYHFFRSPQDMAILFQDLPEALESTKQIMERCSLLLTSIPPALPSFSLDVSEPEELDRQSREGLTKRLCEEVLPTIPLDQHSRIRQEYEDRRAYECEMISRMGFAGYFLIVADFIQWAKNNKIPVGSGRGSGAGSLVAWSLFITDVDSIRFQLFFERFLNPERVSMPDFDVDFCQERRDEVIEYVRSKYGSERVAHIITFGSLQARAVLRDVGRVLQIPYGQVDKICKMVPHNPANPLTLQEALAAEPQITALAQEDESIEKLLTISLKLEGLYRHASTHAAGVIISRDPLRDCVPLYQDEGSLLPATEYSMKYVESAGLVKFDFLGLKTLSVLQTAVNFLAKKNISINLSNLPLDDETTFRILQRGETTGLFQVESPGMTDVLKQLQPIEFQELIALVALYRPGPMDSIPRYIACRHGRETVQYDYDCMQDILKDSFGVMIYQEHVLQIARVLAGYSLGSADLLRRAMGKKIPSEMAMQREKFVQGVIHHYGGTEEKASALFDQIAKFAGYAFPKAHATSYALILYQTAYMKANHPVEFMTALMVHDSHNTDKLRTFVREATRMNIPILPPDINDSHTLFSVTEEGSIRYGLCAIKGVGAAAMEKACQERALHGSFKDIFDFSKRAHGFGVNKKQLESLICAGAFDKLHPGQRGQLMESVDVILKHGGASSSSENLLFDIKESPKLKETSPWSREETLEHERQALGFYLTAHPLEEYTGFFTPYDQIMHTPVTKEGTVCMAGIVMSLTEKISRSGHKYAFLQLSDPSGIYDVTLFSELLAKKRDLLTVGKAVLIQVAPRIEKEDIRLSAMDISSLDQLALFNTIDLVITQNSQWIALSQILGEIPQGTSRIRCHCTLSFNEPPHTCVQVTISLPMSYHITQNVLAHLLPFQKNLSTPALGKNSGNFETGHTL